MSKHFIQGIMVVGVAVVVTGCGIQARSYVQVKERVDQERTAGNAGYLMGGPSQLAPEPAQKTRQIYVLEFSKENVIPDEEMAVTTTAAESTYVPPSPRPERPRIVLPDFEEEFEEPSSAPLVGPDSPVEYTVEKNDTLQKISKKFYDSYSKWPKIYEANKDKIPDPNRIKPGITIVIPPLE